MKKIIAESRELIRIVKGDEMIERCYNCGKEEKITEGFSDIEKIEVDLKDYSDEEEKFMPLCSECVKKWQNGELKGIEERWKAEENKRSYSSTIGEPKYARFWTLISRRRKRKIYVMKA